MFEPMTLPMAMSGLASRTARTAMTSSGADVPAEITTSPMTSGESPSMRASATAPRTSASAPPNSSTRPIPM